MADPTPAPAPPIIKPGIYTSEGWLTFLVAVFGLATTSGFVGPGTTAATVVGGLSTILPTIFYLFHRTNLKKAALP